MATTKRASRSRSQAPEPTPYEMSWREKLADPEHYPAFGKKIATDEQVVRWLEGIIWSGGILTTFEKRVYRTLASKISRPVMV